MQINSPQADAVDSSVHSEVLKDGHFRISEVPLGSGLLVGGATVFNVAGSFCAIEAKCPHQQGPLNEGKLDGSAVTCPWHGSEFNVCTGAVLRGPAEEPVKTYPVIVEGDIGRVQMGKRPIDAGATIRHYHGDAIEVTYDSHRCIHAAECIRGLPAVFNNSRRPWVMPSKANADEIAAVIARCPSGALHFNRSDGGPQETPESPTTIVPTPGGPLYVRGLVELRSAGGNSRFEDLRMALCRCGESHNKPFCDNSHLNAGFNDPGAVPNTVAMIESR